MSRLFYHICQDNAGNLLFDVTGTMRLAGSGTLATIYGDENLTVILPNPMTNHPSFGSFKCFLGSGAYDFYMAKSGYTFETLTGVQGTGTMAQQNANAVAITGGTAALAGLGVTGNANLQGQVGIGQNAEAPYRLAVTGTAVFWQTLSAVELLQVGSGTPNLSTRAYIGWTKANQQALIFRQMDNDTGPGNTLHFENVAGTAVGAIVTTGTTTAYNTTSDARLKHAIAPLTGALDVVRRLRPITHLWRADDSRGYGFVASEVQDTLPADAGVVTGERDAVDEVGNILPQMIDYGKLVPWLTAALNDAIGALDTLTARVASLEQQLGV